MDSNHRRRKPADLQSAPFGHSGICPFQNQEIKEQLQEEKQEENKEQIEEQK